MTQALAVGFAMTGAPVVHAAPVAYAPADDTSSDFSSERARSLYESGIVKFDAGDYEGALVDLDASLEIETQASSLYAKAQSFNKLGRCRDAVPIYNRVLQMLPETSSAADAVKDAMVICAEKMVAEGATVEPPAEDEDVEPEVEPLDEGPADDGEKRWYADVVAPVLLGAGLVGVTVGGVFLGRASQLDPANAPSYGEFVRERDDQRSAQITGGIGMGIGSALVLGGIVRYIVVASRGRRERDVALVPMVAPQRGRWSAGLGFSGRF